MARPLTVAKLATRASSGAAEVEARQRQLDDFQSFYLQHVEVVRRVVARLWGPHGDIDDAVQEVFLVAWRKRDGFAGRAEPSTWLYAIARRVVLAARRRAQLRRWLGLEAAAEHAHEQTPHQIFEHREANRRLYALLERLSEKRRTVFVLHEIEGLPGEAIARILGCPVKTVWTRLHHARRQLQTLAADTDERSPA
jgi:RNA polymerase sigma-70 factor, ECF subfamily